MTDIALDEKALEAACAATVLGEDADGKPVHLEPQEAATAIRAYLRSSPPQVVSQPQAGEAVAVGGLYGPFGWLNGCRGLSEDSWELESDPLENSEEYFAIPLYALTDPFKEVGPLYASPQPANPAQVTDAMVEAALKAFHSTRRHTTNRPAMRAALAAAIGAGGQAVVEDAETLKARTASVLCEAGALCGWPAPNCNAREGAEALFKAGLLALSQPHPADERVVEALREAQDWISNNIREGDIAGCSLLGKIAALATEGR